MKQLRGIPGEAGFVSDGFAQSVSQEEIEMVTNVQNWQVNHFRIFLLGASLNNEAVSDID